MHPICPRRARRVILAFAAGHALARVGAARRRAARGGRAVHRGRGRGARPGGATLVLTPMLVAAELWRSTRRSSTFATIPRSPRRRRRRASWSSSRSRRSSAAGRRCSRCSRSSRCRSASRSSPGGTGGILIPLYVVIAAGGLAYLVRRPRGATGARGGRARARARGVRRAVRDPGAVHTRRGLAKAVEDVGFFLVPFSLLFVLLRRVEWDRALLARCASQSSWRSRCCSSRRGRSSTRAGTCCSTPASTPTPASSASTRSSTTRTSSAASSR